MNNGFRLAFNMKMEEGANEAEIMVYGEICDYKWFENDVTATDFDKAIKKAKADGAEKLNIRINSPGGYVYQAVAMRSMLEAAAKDMDVYVNIEGLCASAATMLCCVQGVKKVSIAKGSEFMIHNPMTGIWGNYNDLMKEAEHLKAMADSCAKMYADKTGKTVEEMQSLMDAETWYTAEQAVEAGFADEIYGTPAAACAGNNDMEMMRMMYAHIPETIIVSNAEPDTAGDAAENKKSEQEEQEMNYKDITAEALREGNEELYNSIMSAGAKAERERINEIDELTPAGYEQMAAEAKENGTSAMDFHKAIIKAERDKKAAYLNSRVTETAPAAEVKGMAAEDESDEDEITKNAKEMAAMAAVMDGDSAGMR